MLLTTVLSSNKRWNLHPLSGITYSFTGVFFSLSVVITLNISPTPPLWSVYAVLECYASRGIFTSRFHKQVTKSYARNVLPTRISKKIPVTYSLNYQRFVLHPRAFSDPAVKPNFSSFYTDYLLKRIFSMWVNTLAEHRRRADDVMT